MRFHARKEFTYDAAMATRADTKLAMNIYHEYVTKYSCNPGPTFFEVDADASSIDPLWHMPVANRATFSRTLKLPALHTADKPDWRQTRIGVVPNQKHNFTLSNVALSENDYFPRQGDLVFWDGYRLQIMDASIDPGSYWLQTNVWLGMVVRCQIVPDGDMRPVLDPSKPVQAELSPHVGGGL